MDGYALAVTAPVRLRSLSFYRLRILSRLPKDTIQTQLEMFAREAHGELFIFSAWIRVVVFVG
jgi:hypothetical protein